MVIVGDAREILDQAREYCSHIEIMDKNGKEIDPESLEAAGDGTPANAAGKWALALDFQGQQMPIEMTLEQEGSAITGNISTMLGTGEIKDGSLEGDRFTELDAVAGSRMQTFVPSPLRLSMRRVPPDWRAIP